MPPVIILIEYDAVSSGQAIVLKPSFFFQDFGQDARIAVVHAASFVTIVPHLRQRISINDPGVR